MNIFHNFCLSVIYRYEALESDEEKGSDNDSDVSSRPVLSRILSCEVLMQCLVCTLLALCMHV